MQLMPFSERKKITRPWWRKPLRYLLRMRPRHKHLQGSVAHKLLGSRLLEAHLWIPGRRSTALGMAVGLFVGFLPLLGLQIILSALVCFFLRSNIPTAILATMITNPFTTAGILWGQIKLGQWLAPAFSMVEHTGATGLSKYFEIYGKPLLVGSLVSAFIASLLGYLATHGVWQVVESAVIKRKAARKRKLAMKGQNQPP